MHIIDLSMPIFPDHVRWKAERTIAGDVQKGDLYQVTTVKVSCHSFTHVDAKRHYFSDGRTIDETRLEDVVGFADVIDLMDVAPNEAIDAGKLGPRLAGVAKGAKIILKSGWHRHRSFREKEFWLDSPWLTRDAAALILSKGVATIAYDFPQDYCIRLLLSGQVRPIDEHVTHDILLRNGVHMIEYLTNTTEITSSRVLLSAAPLKIEGADGSPARVYAIEGLG